MAKNNKNKTVLKIAGLKYPASDQVESRTSTLSRAMACTTDPRIACSQDVEKKWLKALGQRRNALKCAYCGEPATHLDHLNPLIKNKFPTGYITEPGNLVPCCAKCNQRKGNKNYEEYINSDKCPGTSEGKEKRIKCIKKLESEFHPQNRDWSNDPDFNKAWEEAQDICNKALKEAQKILAKFKDV